MIVWMFNYMTGEIFIVAPTLEKAASLKPVGRVLLFISIFITIMIIGFGLGALVHNLLG